MAYEQVNRCSLDDPQVRVVLERAHQSAEERWQARRGRRGRRLIKAVARTLLGRELFGMIAGWARSRMGSRPVAREARQFGESAPALSRAQGLFAYLVARSVGARRIVEFGTGFGVSTMYLAAAVKDNGGGIVIGSEIGETKVATARARLEEAGLADYVDVRLGDARETLADPGGQVDMALLDGAKDLYLPILKMLLPHLRPAAVVLADNIESFKGILSPYVAYVSDTENGFQSVTLPFSKGFEYSVRLPAPVALKGRT